VLGEHQETLSWGGHIGAGGRAVKNKQCDKWQEEGATSRIPAALPGEGGAAVRRSGLPSEPSTDPGSDPSLAGSVPSWVTPAPRSPGHSLLLPSQLPVEARQRWPWPCAGKMSPAQAGKNKRRKPVMVFQGTSWLFLAWVGAWGALAMPWQ